MKLFLLRAYLFAMNASNQPTKIEILKTWEEQLSREDRDVDSNEVATIIKKMKDVLST